MGEQFWNIDVLKMSGLFCLWEELIDWKAVEDRQHITQHMRCEFWPRWEYKETVGIQSVAQSAEDGVKKLWYSQDTMHGLLCSTWNYDDVVCLHQITVLLLQRQICEEWDFLCHGRS